MEGNGMRRINIRVEIDPQLYMEELMDVVRNAVDSSSLLRKEIAYELDVDPSMLSRMLSDNPDETVNLPAYKLPILIKILNDQKIADWFICQCKADKSALKQEISNTRRRHQGELKKLDKWEQLIDGSAGS